MKRFFAGFFLACCLIACAAAPTFNYKFYHLTGNNYAGTLLGAKPQDDVPFSQCAPTGNKQKCVVVFYSELEALIADYKKTKSDLIACQKGRK